VYKQGNVDEDNLCWVTNLKGTEILCFTINRNELFPAKRVSFLKVHTAKLICEVFIPQLCSVSIRQYFLHHVQDSLSNVPHFPAVNNGIKRGIKKHQAP